MISKDYYNIETIIDDIVGIETQQGGNLVKAIKKYFEEKTISVKLVNPDISIYNDYQSPGNNLKIDLTDKEADEVLTKNFNKLKAFSNDLKKKGKFKGVCSTAGD
jgi:diphthamide synthase subunit DPH2